MIEKNLTLTHQQRLENHQAALDLFVELKTAGKNFYAKSEKTFKKDN